MSMSTLAVKTGKTTFIHIHLKLYSKIEPIYLMNDSFALFN